MNNSDTKALKQEKTDTFKLFTIIHLGDLGGAKTHKKDSQSISNLRYFLISQGKKIGIL